MVNITSQKCNLHLIRNLVFLPPSKSKYLPQFRYP